jgi:PBP1b-binding outer membrane lipoprotein LpoB
MRILSIAILSLLLTGCASMDVVKRDQLTLDVPKSLMVPPEALRNL